MPRPQIATSETSDWSRKRSRDCVYFLQFIDDIDCVVVFAGYMVLSYWCWIYWY